LFLVGHFPTEGDISGLLTSSGVAIFVYSERISSEAGWAIREVILQEVRKYGQIYRKGK